MKAPAGPAVYVLAAALGAASSVAAAELDPKNPLNPPGTIYWCPDQTLDRQYSANPEPGCSPLVGKAEKSFKELKLLEKQPGATLERPPVKIQDIMPESLQFLDRYRRFLSCCANDPGSIDDLQDLEDQALHLLRSMQQTGFVNMSTSQRGFTVSYLLRNVAYARDDLRKLKKRLQSLDQAYDKLDSAGYEKAGSVRRDIEQEEKSISKDFRPKKPVENAPTGTEIGNTTLPNRVGTANDNTTLPSAFGSDIGQVGSPDSDQRKDLRPRIGRDLDVSGKSTLPSREGTATGDTTLPNTTGQEIGTSKGPTDPTTLPNTAGPETGGSLNSSFNKR
jgi:hypothetical protein